MTAHQAEKIRKAGGSRELSRLCSSTEKNRKLPGKCIIVGDSREPPVLTRFWRDSRYDECWEGAIHTLKAAPLQALGDTDRISPTWFRGRGRRRVRERCAELPIQPMIDRLELREKVSINLISCLQFLGLIRPRLQTNLFLPDCGGGSRTIGIYTCADAG